MASISTPAPRSASPAQRHFRPRLPCSSCWHFISAGSGSSRSPTAWPSSNALESVPGWLGEVLKTEPLIEQAAERFDSAKSALFLGRDLHFPVALEGALKLKEISYIHAEGYPTAEMKHGPIALVDGETPCVFVAPRGSLHAKTLSNLEEVKARNGTIITVGTEGDHALRACPMSSCPCPMHPRSCSRSWLSCRSSYWPTMSRDGGLRYRQTSQSGQERDGRVKRNEIADR